MADCHVLNAAKICLQAVKKGPMAALFQTWPKKWLFYLIIGHVVIQNNNNNNNKRKKKEAASTSCQPGFLFIYLFIYYYYYYYYFSDYVKMHEVYTVGWRNFFFLCVQYALTL